jgi:hypothetical protein
VHVDGSGLQPDHAVADQLPAVEDGEAACVEVEQLAGQLLGQFVLGVVLAGLVDLLDVGQQAGERGRVGRDDPAPGQVHPKDGTDPGAAGSTGFLGRNKGVAPQAGERAWCSPTGCCGCPVELDPRRCPVSHVAVDVAVHRPVQPHQNPR